MPTTYSDQFWIIDPYAPPPVGTVLSVSFFNIVDQNNNGLINRFSNDRIDGSDIRASYVGDTVTVTLAGGSTVTITGSTFYLADGRQVFTPTDGSLLTNATLVGTSFVTNQSSMPVGSLGPPCFTPGTLISTANGPRDVECLQIGDLVQTVDKGPVPVCYIHGRTLLSPHLEQHPEHRPIRISAGALGQNLPERDLVVSPQHRMLISSPVAARMFGDTEILVPACQLVGLQGISRVKSFEPVQYIHILLDHHGVIFANEAPAETLFLGPQIHEDLSEREVDVIRNHLPFGVGFTMRPARQFVRGSRLKKLLERHLTNDKPLLDRDFKQPLVADEMEFVG